MREQILDLVKEKPKHYVRIIKNNPELLEWVKNNSLIDSSELKENIYSSLYQESNICPYGNKRKITRISQGWVNCGPSKVCRCTSEQISEGVSKTKLEYTDNQKLEIKYKREKTMLDRFGVKYNNQRPEILQKLKKNKVSDDVFELLNSKEWLSEEYNNKKRSLVDIGKELGIYYGTVGEYCRKHGFKIRKKASYSLVEKEVLEWIKSKDIKCIENDWEILKNLEIDIYLPEYKLGIEVNGLFWHSYNPYHKQYKGNDSYNRHQNKSLSAQKEGIDIIHITDYEWYNKRDIIKSLILTRLGLSKKYYARKMKIKLVDKSEEKEFLNSNHLQGYIPSTKAYGLYSDNELIMMISIGKSRYSKDYDLEMLRVCSKLGCIVVGGLEKLFKCIRNDYVSSSIVSYCDISKFRGSSYRRLGFKLLRLNKPGYFWTDGNDVVSRYKSQKHQLKGWLLNYREDISESENMFRAGYRRYYDCGNQVWYR